MPLRVSPTDIVVGDRQRKAFDSVAAEKLKLSIQSQGLLHAPVCRWDALLDKFVLVSGERRLRALAALASEGFSFTYDGELYPPGELPIVKCLTADPEAVATAEFEENEIRADLTWTERTTALARIEELGRAKGKSATVVAEELVERHGRVPVTEGKGGTASVSTVRSALSRAAVVAKHLSNPEIAKSRNEREAYAKILAQDEAAVHAALRAASPPLPGTESYKLIHGDALALMPEMEDAQFDLVLTDPPYGIGANSAGWRNKTSSPHEYSDSPDDARALIQAIMLQGFRLAKPRANLFMFIDIDMWSWAKECAQMAGWECWRTPILWTKSMTEGLAPWGSQGFTRSYEMALYATKGTRGLYYTVPDVMFAPRLKGGNKVFAAQKPHAILSKIIKATTTEGDTVFDPCAGSGSTLRTSRLLGRLATGIEKVESTYNSALQFIDSEKEDSEDDAENEQAAIDAL